MLSSKVLYDELKALIIEQYMEEHFPKGGILTTEKEKQLDINNAVREAKIELLEKILELR